MGRRRLISFMLMTFLSFSAFAESNPENKCRTVEIHSTSVPKKEKIDLCFMNDETYFISRNCQDLNCGFMKRLKEKKAQTSSAERPGAITCKGLRGIIEGIQIPGLKAPTQRCLFAKEKSSISLNLLESWDGQKFAGPSIPQDL